MLNYSNDEVWIGANKGRALRDYGKIEEPLRALVQ
jgi:hypothetical protein